MADKRELVAAQKEKGLRFLKISANVTGTFENYKFIWVSAEIFIVC